MFVGMTNFVKVSSKQSIFYFCFLFHLLLPLILVYSTSCPIWYVDMLQAWNTESGAEYNLDGPVGQVYALETTDDVLFAGGQVTLLVTLLLPQNFQPDLILSLVLIKFFVFIFISI